MVSYSAFSLEAAACLWEGVLTLRDNPVTTPDGMALALQIRRAFEVQGTAAMRLIAIGWTDAVEVAWQAQDEDFPDCFDWDFVPEWIVANIDWSDSFSPVQKG